MINWSLFFKVAFKIWYFMQLCNIYRFSMCESLWINRWINSSALMSLNGVIQRLTSKHWFRSCAVCAGACCAYVVSWDWWYTTPFYLHYWYTRQYCELSFANKIRMHASYFLFTRELRCFKVTSSHSPVHRSLLLLFTTLLYNLFISTLSIRTQFSNISAISNVFILFLVICHLQWLISFIFRSGWYCWNPSIKQFIDCQLNDSLNAIHCEENIQNYTRGFLLQI